MSRFGSPFCIRHCPQQAAVLYSAHMPQVAVGSNHSSNCAGAWWHTICPDLMLSPADEPATAHVLIHTVYFSESGAPIFGCRTRGCVVRRPRGKPPGPRTPSGAPAADGQAPWRCRHGRRRLGAGTSRFGYPSGPSRLCHARRPAGCRAAPAAPPFPPRGPPPGQGRGWGDRRRGDRGEGRVLPGVGVGRPQIRNNPAAADYRRDFARDVALHFGRAARTIPQVREVRGWMRGDRLVLAARFVVTIGNRAPMRADMDGAARILADVLAQRTLPYVQLGFADPGEWMQGAPLPE